ncbi:MAG: hypothetical protein IPK03_15285 [Bacteroidetes bacterium]|nr:hypothetical protein [Bacteroidota bacterium]
MIKLWGQNTTVKQTFSINRDKPNWSAEYEYYFNKNAFLLSNGIDARRIRSHTIKTRLQLSEWITWRNQFTQSFKVNTSEFFKEKNFDFIGNNYITKLIFQTSKSWRFEWGYDYKFQSNKIYQFSTMNDASLEVKWNQSEKSLAEARFDFITVGYSEIERNPQVEFAMLGGIQKGNNYVWSLTFDRRLSESIQLNIVYQGRKNNLIDGFIHSLSAEIRNNFLENYEFEL